MATVKSYTDLEQSKVLAEILPLESADMVYVHTVDLEGDEHYDIDFRNNQPLFKDDISAWSLAALLDVLPEKYTKLLIKEGGAYRILIKDLCMTSLFNNPVDACVAMIEELYKLNLL